MKLRFAFLILSLGLLSAAAEAQEAASVVYTDASAFSLFGKATPETAARYQRFPASFEEVSREPLWQLSQNSTGLYLRFRSDAPSIHARWFNRGFHMPHMTDAGVGGLDLYAFIDWKWRFVGSGFTWDGENPHERRLVGNMQPSMREYMLYLPLYDALDSLEIGVPEGYALLEPALPSPSAERPVVMYGTSILQGGCASRPGMAHTAILSRALDREVINLGFSGNALLDMEVAELIARVKDPSVVVLDYVPNASAEMIREQGEAFFRVIRTAHPSVPVIFVEDPIFPHSIVDQAIAAEIASKNAAQAELFARLVAAGEKDLFYIPAEGLIGTDGESTVDGIHLTDLGMLRYAERLLPVMREVLKER